MLKLLMLFFGMILLMYLSNYYYPQAPGEDPAKQRHFAADRSDLFVGLAIFYLASFMFLRTNYNDTAAYIRGFRNAVSPEEFIANGELSDLTGNPLFYFYNTLARSVTDNYHLFFLLPSLLIAFACVRLFKRYSVSPAFSVVVFFAIGTPMILMAAMKQGIATAILILSIPYALDRKYVRFYLLVALAALFHTYALIFAVVPLLCRAPWGTRTWILLAATVFCLLTFDSTMGIVVEQLQEIGAHASEEDVFNNTKINILRVAVYLVPALLALLFRERLFRDSTREENLFVNISILSGFLLMLGLEDGSNMMARIAAFFEIGSAVCLPWIIDRLFTKRSAKLVIGMAAVLYFGYFLYEFMVSKNFQGDYSAISLWQFVVGLFS